MPKIPAVVCTEVVKKGGRSGLVTRSGQILTLLGRALSSIANVQNMKIVINCNLNKSNWQKKNSRKSLFGNYWMFTVEKLLKY